MRSAFETRSFLAGQSRRDAFEEWKRISAGRLCDYSGMTYKAIEQHGGLQWPLPAGTAPDDEARRLYTDGRFQTDDGRARLIPCTWEPFPEQPNKEFPFVLNTGRTVEHWHTRTKTGKVPILERLSPNAWVEMNPADARALRLKPQARVDIVSRRGRMQSVELRVTETVAPGQLFAPFHYFEANANQVTQSAFDPISREPNYKQSAVRIELASKEVPLWDRSVVREQLVPDSGRGAAPRFLFCRATIRRASSPEPRIPNPGCEVSR